MKNRELEEREACFIVVEDNLVFVIPKKYENDWDSTPYYERVDTFECYLLPDGAVISDVLVDRYDFDCIIRGDF